MNQSIYLITGLMASGKSTVAQLLAERLDKAVHLRGDVFRRMIVTGREDMSAEATEEAFRQLYLRYQLTAENAKMYFEQGFSVVIQDNYYGPALSHMIEFLDGYPVCVVVLCPDCETILQREQAREKKGYIGYDVEPLYESFMVETPRIGCWIDNSRQLPQETVEMILKYVQADNTTCGEA